MAFATVAMPELRLGIGPAGAQGIASIAEILVEGNQRIEADTVRSYMTVRSGDPFDAAEVDKSLKALFATGLFADVTIRRQGTSLVVSVVENPIINRLAFEGNRKISDETLDSEVQLRPRVVYTRARVQSDVQRIIEIYRRSGRFAATVEPKVIQLPQNRVDLVFEINEGEVTEIRKIRFIGNRAFSDSRLRRETSTKEAVWYRFLTVDDTYDPDRLTLDRELLRKFYLSNGYADFRVVSAVAELTPNREEFFVTFTVDEGEVYTFGEIDLETEIKDLDPEQLRNLIQTIEGETYNADLIETTIEDLTFELGRLGYAFVDIRPRVERDRDNNIIDLTYEINEGPRVYVERIDIVGNVRTLDKVVRREFRLVEGDAFNTAKLRRSRSRIRGLAFFERVEITNEQGSAPDKTVIKVEVAEKPTGELSLGAGFSTTETIIGDVAIRERNLLGRGQDLRLAFSLSAVRRQIDLSFTEPYFLDKPISAGVDVFNTSTDLQDRSSFDRDSTGGAVRMGFDITERLRQTLNYTFRRDNISDVDDDASRFIRDQEGSTTTSSVGYRLRYDRRDDPIEPTSGYIVTLNQDFAGLGGSVRNIRTTLKYAHYFEIFDKVVASIALNEGYVLGLGQDVEINQRFFIGGDSFRGFENGGIGPRDITTDDALGGNLYYVGTAELQFPLGLPEEFGILGRIFTEAGSLVDVDEDGPEIFDDGSVRASSGVGLSWRSPFGPIRLDFAQPWLKEDADEIEVFRFSFGTRF
ncbi:MAG: outer membrane protein assembly factor BamA [Minwuiales bacterium]|nr:outer membrane protein assembly factor BamA [Minwuiales bacterium]